MSSIHKVTVLGATGNTGVPIVHELINAGFEVTALTRGSSSQASLPSNVKIVSTDYSQDSLVKAFTGQDAIVSTIATFSTQEQSKIIDAAVAAEVKRFIPSEFGIDTQDTELQKHVPPVRPKQETVQYLRTKEKDGLSWTAVIVGGFFDWTLKIPGGLGFVIPARKANIFDGGDTEFEVTNMSQIGRAVAACLKKPDETKNQYVYVNSFTVTQNEVLRCLEKVMGDKFETSPARREEVWKGGMEKMKDGGMDGFVEVVMPHIHDLNGFNHYSKTRGLWNDRLGLPKEDLEETLRSVVKSYNA